jgi:hypothetical protein
VPLFGEELTAEASGPDVGVRDKVLRELGYDLDAGEVTDEDIPVGQVNPHASAAGYQERRISAPQPARLNRQHLEGSMIF